MKRLIFLISIAILPHLVYSQNLPIYNQYHFNKYLVNTAAAGANFYGTSVGFYGRQQWMGIPGAPRTGSVAATSLLNAENAIGLLIGHDTYGYMKDISFRLSYAYHSKLSEKANLSLGLGFEGSQYTFNPSFVDPIVLVDRINNLTVPSKFFYNFTAGAYYYSDKAYFGVSASNIIKKKIGNQEALPSQLFFVGGRVFPVSYKKMMDITYAFRVNDDLDIGYDLNAKLIFDNKFWAGLSYRSPKILMAMTGVNVGYWSFGYAFEWSLTKIMLGSYGSHEVMISYNIPSKKFRNKVGPFCPAYH